MYRLKQIKCDRRGKQFILKQYRQLKILKLWDYKGKYANEDETVKICWDHRTGENQLKGHMGPLQEQWS